ncbi:hypothetical protein Afil01_59250 [Actinorhabdospora filicis]|uniref:DinB family protein n=1 Tax=Actinorhabdospora filicis TaxID=1785913 RepID=A0A9W6SS73_9ACTN|nr:DinB family protein [Actinorhabdospora filicis]GLZ81118.1 hypothetical protein Afil01_59250 [Actinorhabdospora filicis]
MSPRRAELYAGDESRFTTDATADERTILTGMLAAQRRTFEMKCAGLTGEQLRSRAVEPSTLSLLGLVRHLTDVERRWVRMDLAGEDAGPLYSSPEHPDGDFEGAGDVEADWDAWREQVAFTTKYIEANDLDAGGRDHWRGPLTLRWVIAHLIEEYARHLGHADLLRERIDGSVGL